MESANQPLKTEGSEARGANPFLEQRDGEPLETALADAEKKARAFRVQATEALQHAEKWEAVAVRLREARELSRHVGPISKPAPVSVSAQTPSNWCRVHGHQLTRCCAEWIPLKQAYPEQRKPRGFWWEQVREFVKAYFMTHQVGPTKRKVVKSLAEKFPATVETTFWSTVNQAIADNRLAYRIDYLYLPEDDPGVEGKPTTAVAAAS